MSRTKDGVGQIVGKRITAVVMTENSKTGPQSQLYLAFSDGTSFEFWVNSDRIVTASCVDDDGVDHILKIAKDRPHNEVWEFPASDD